MLAPALLAIVDRDGFDESFHVGHAAVVAPDGSVVRTLGDGDAAFLPRSTLKALFAASMRTLGVPLEGEHLALACASIARQSWHIDLARAMAAELGVDEHDVRCPPMRAEGGATETRFANVCIGKHIAMAAAARMTGGGPDYADPAHPLQVRLAAAVATLTGVQSIATATDGCGAPVVTTSAIGLARAYRGLVTPIEHPLAEHLLAAGRAMLQHPDVVEGTGMPDSIVIAETGCIAKFGAEATQVVVAPDGTTAAVRILDGARRAGPLVALTLLEHAGALEAGTADSLAAPLGLVVRGGGRAVGRVRTAF